MSAVADTKTYNGTQASNLTPAASWLATGDTLTGVQQYSDKNAGNGKTLTVTSYSIDDGNGGNNYNVTAVNTNTGGVINKAALTVTADNASRYAGQPNPAFTVSYSGLAGSDTPVSLSGSLTFATTATSSSPAGQYAITLTGTLASPNYTINYAGGVLTVRPVTVRPASNAAYLGAVGSSLQTRSGGGSTGNGFGPNGYWGMRSGLSGHMNGIFGPLYTITGSGINLSGLGQSGQDRLPIQ